MDPGLAVSRLEPSWHGLGGPADLPISLSLAMAGGAAALVVSFSVLALAWRSPRYDAAPGRPLPPAVARVLDSRGLLVLTRALGLAFTGYVAWAALRGPDNLANPTFGVVYVWLWVGLVPASLLLGPVYRAVSPVRALHGLLSRVTGGDAGSGLLRLPRWVGLWPAAAGLFAFVWLELVSPEAAYLSSIRVWFALYFAVLLIGAAVFGDRWIAAADPFEVYSTLVGHLAVVGRRPDGTLVLRSPLANLATVPPSPGLAGVVAVLLGSTAWDSFSDSVAWIRFSTAQGGGVVADTLGLLVFCAGVFATFWAAAAAVGTGDEDETARSGNLLAHSVVPIVVGYVIAHYLTYLVQVGQQTLVQLSDPMVDGSNLLGTADLSVSYWLTEHPTLLAWTKVLAIVGGHVLGVVSAHDRAVRLLPRERQLTPQLPLLLVMVCYTVGGLYLLLSV